MARMPRIAVPGCPHHVTARGNRREPIFFEDGDQDIYCDMLAEHTRKADVDVWAYCLMPNHVHLVLCPSDEKGLSKAVGAAHKRWANFINGRGRWRGHLFENRFASVAMDEGHLISAIRYVALNPVRARLVARAEDWKWSSVRAHLEGKDDGLVRVGPVLGRVKEFAALIADRTEDAGFAALRAAEHTGRPLGTRDFIEGLERVLGRRIARRAPGRKPTKPPDDQQSLF
jgi:putative transposase